MLLRHSLALRRVVQGVPGAPAASAWLHTASSGLQGGSEQPGRQQPGSEGESLLAYWRGLLDERQRYGGGAGELSDDDVRQLLHTALRVRQGKAQSSLPEQLMAVFMQYYRQLDHVDRLALFHNLTTSFGIQAAEVDAAAAAWRQVRQQQQQQPAAAAAAGGTSFAAAGARSAAAARKAAAAEAAAAEPLLKASAQLSAAATPLYVRLFVPLSQLPGGIKFLADMRAELLQAIQEHPSGAAPLRALSDALRRSLAEWFSVGLLQLHPITWAGSSAALLEKVAAGEAVHNVASWQDLKTRLDPTTRRVYAFFHEAMPGEPLVVLHTALTSTVARSMQQLLPQAAAAAAAPMGLTDAAGHPAVHGGQQQHHHRQPAPAAVLAAAGPSSDRTWEQQQQHEQQQQTHRLPLAAGTDSPPLQRQQQWLQPSVAVFYSISATQRGLAGVDLGNFLIKQVAHRLLAEFPQLDTLCTLSPLPGFASWLRLQLARAEQRLPPAAPLLLPGEAAALEAVAAGHLPAAPSSSGSSGSGASAPANPSQHEQLEQLEQQQQRAAALLGWAIADDNWMHSSRLEAAAEAPLLRLAAHYLLRERRRGLALDPVANFHLRNGAAVLQLSWRGDVSPAGLQRSHGVMVNYVYDLERLQDNNRAYLVDGRVTAAPELEALAALGDGQQQ